VAKGRKRGVAASLAAHQVKASVLDEPIESRAIPRPRNTYGGGFFWDSAGIAWHRIEDWLDRERAITSINAGADWAVEYCEGQLVYSSGMSTEELREKVLPLVLASDQVAKARARRRVPTVFVGELWRDDDDRELVVFHESAPRPRAASWFL
jgi:hypothetical protein